MVYVYILFIIAVIGFVCYRMIKKKSAPSNRYTPYDDVTLGMKDDNQDYPLKDTKHHIPYEEKANNGKNG